METMLMISILIVAVVEILYNILYKWLTQELLELNIGYEPNKRRLEAMTTLVHAIDYIENSNPSTQEVIEIIQYYEEI